MSQASWDWAVWHLRSAVAHNPEYIYHRLELAEVLVDVRKYAEAREQLAAIPSLPVRDVLDAQYKREAAELLERTRDKKDKA
jgi:thioredoxin-like negative regulator of GroEL